MANETLTQRVKRIISGSANALVSAIEDLSPESVMEEAIREVEAAADEVRTELGRVLASKHLASKRLMEENKRHDQLAEQVELAVDKGREDLAKTAIAQQLDIEAQIPVLEASISDATASERELEGYVQALAAKRREMQNELENFRATRKRAAVEEVNVAATTNDSPASKVARAESAFDRLMHKHAGVPGLRGTPDAKTAVQLSELADMSRSNRIEERLAQLKARRDSDASSE